MIDVLSGGCQSVGKLLPELKLYWFESMLTKRHDGRIWKEYIYTVFPCTSEVDNLTVESLRMQLHDECEVIRKLRNRIAHHEPIFNQEKLVKILPYIRKTIGYRCAETLVWFDKYEVASSLLERKVI